jgi:hypothetical protein
MPRTQGFRDCGVRPVPPHTSLFRVVRGQSVDTRKTKPSHGQSSPVVNATIRWHVLSRFTCGDLGRAGTGPHTSTTTDHAILGTPSPSLCRLSGDGESRPPCLLVLVGRRREGSRSVERLRQGRSFNACRSCLAVERGVGLSGSRRGVAHKRDVLRPLKQECSPRFQRQTGGPQ